ncbi:VWA domain-containing protein [Tenacibaculum finnmarkense]|uniref:VWA domain-containing protein n=1 Tax=Tenacibaculum finnmarkense TaxID=2781243 RepID=UPI001E65605A|nr:VWA domain-containing protein [Tenacibaculum finnmarkense]MCD8400665.1 VWA domain-containing protein [Tenacibaculum finnmarkense genomovar ulcerans]
MEKITIIYLVLAVLLSVAIAYFQYFYKTTRKSKRNKFLFTLKALSLFLLFLLLINPKIKSIETQNIKPVLSILVDNSSSIKYFNAEKTVASVLKTLKNSTKITDKFDIQSFSFDKKTTVLSADSLNFSGTQTAIYQAINAVNKLQKECLNATVLITDGNQTNGNEYQYITSKNKIFPVVIGDTTAYQDLQISQVNVNKYSYIKNKFPVEALVYYQGEFNGKEQINATFSITHQGKKVFSKKVAFSADNPTKTITTNLTSDKKGIQYYKTSISQIKNEKNTKNNYQNFSVEVIDEQTKVLILSAFLHPDIRAIKKSVESNKQRKVDIAFIKDIQKINLDNYQFFVFYQPNSSFKKVFEKVTSNYLIVSGTKTDWNFLNTQNLGVQKEAIKQSENYTALYNANFLPFLQKDINFNDFPPLKDVFGDITITGEAQVLLHQKYAGFKTKEPLLATIENFENKNYKTEKSTKNNQKHAVLFGEGIWKWRSASFLESQGFENFDAFLSNLVQYLASNKKRKRLSLKSKSSYLQNEAVTISAFYVDENYKFDNRASLEITITNTLTKHQKTLPFSLVNNSYQVSISDLYSGYYSYKVAVKNNSNQKINSYGKFKITEFNIEEQFVNANDQKLHQLALKTAGKLIYPDKIDNFLTQLSEDKTYYTTQKSSIKKEHLINWKWLLSLIIVLFSVEWFIRKFDGKI